MSDTKRSKFDHPKTPPKNGVRCHTVAQLAKALAAFDPKTPVSAGFGEGVRITIYNIGLNDEHVEIEEGDDE